MPFFSVVIPLFNKSAFIDRAIGSVLAQSHRDFELIVVDDGSSDDSLKRARAYLGDARVRVMTQANQGPAAARNAGLRAAAGAWIALLDADDEWLPDYLATMAAAIRTLAHGDNVVLCYAQFRADTVADGAVVVLDDYYAALERNACQPILPSFAVVARDAIMASGGFPEWNRTGDDAEAWFRLHVRGRFAYVRRMLGRYHRDDPASVLRTGITNLDWVRSYREIRHLPTCSPLARRYVARGLIATVGSCMAHGRYGEAARRLLSWPQALVWGWRDVLAAVREARRRLARRRRPAAAGATRDTPRKHLFSTSHVLYTNELNVLLDEAEAAFSRGEAVTFLLCDESIGQCSINVTGSRAYCRLCLATAHRALASLSQRVETRHLREFRRPAGPGLDAAQALAVMRSGADLVGVTYRGVDVGYGVRSHIIDITRNNAPALTPPVSVYLRRCLESSVRMTDAYLNALQALAPGRVSLFNWRLYDARPLFRLARLGGMEVWCWDFAFSRERREWDKFVMVNSHLHDCEAMAALIERAWLEANARDPRAATAKAESFFTLRRRGAADGAATLFTLRQETGRLPRSWDPKVRNIVIFNSSEDEFGSIDSAYDAYRYAATQIETIRIVLTLATGMRRPARFYIRVHPNLRGVTHAYHQRIYDLPRQFDNVEIIPPDSAVSTYDLMEQAEKVIVFGSTAGIEAVFWGRPVILLGPASYRFLNACHTPKNDGELAALLDADLPVPDRLPALKYGYFAVCERGIPFRKVRYEYEGPRLLGIPLPFHFARCRVLGSSRLYALLALGYAGLCFPLMWRRRRALLKALKDAPSVAQDETPA